jgi:hypothetical protein
LPGAGGYDIAALHEGDFAAFDRAWTPETPAT